jgi:cytochrome P450
MSRFSGTYSASFGTSAKIIITQNPDFISYVLRENHKNYSKSQISTQRASMLFGNGLLTSNGAYWLNQRRLIQPAFHREKLQGLYSIIIRAIEDYLPEFPVGENVDIYLAVHRLSFSILIKSLFDINLPAETVQELASIFSEMQDFLAKDAFQPIRKLFYPVTGAERRIIQKAKRLRQILAGIIRERTASNEQYADLLDMLLNSKYEDTGEGMTEEQLIDEVLILIFAGHETTANTLAWMLRLIAENAEVQRKLRASISNSPVPESLNNEYIKATINEGMRLYPAAWITERLSLEDDSFGEFSYPRGTIIAPFFYGLHRDEKLWPNAGQFNPERFIGDTTVTKSKKFFPFGAGPRMCIGNIFALTEMSFFMHLFFKAFYLRPTGQVPVMKAQITLSPDRVLLNVEAAALMD